MSATTTTAAAHARRRQPCRSGDRGRELRILGEDLPLELAQAGSWLDPELRRQHSSGTPVRLERVCLAPAVVEGQHEVRPEALAVRVLSEQPLELRDDVRMTTEREIRGKPIFERVRPKLVEPGSLARRERLAAKVGERLPSPQRERLTEELCGKPGFVGLERAPSLLREPLEAVQVEIAGVDQQRVAVPAEHQLATGAVLREELPEPRCVHLQRLAPPRRRLLAPKLVDQTLPWDDLVRTE